MFTYVENMASPVTACVCSPCLYACVELRYGSGVTSACASTFFGTLCVRSERFISGRRAYSAFQALSLRVFHVCASCVICPEMCEEWCLYKCCVPCRRDYILRFFWCRLSRGVGSTNSRVYHSFGDVAVGQG